MGPYDCAWRTPSQDLGGRGGLNLFRPNGFSANGIPKKM